MCARTILAALVAASGLTAALADDEPPADPEFTFHTERAPRFQPAEGPLDFGPRAYAEAGVSVFGFTAESSDSQVGGTLRGGVAFNPLFAIEADFSVLEEADGVVVSIVPDLESQSQFTLIREPDQVSSAFARGSWPLGDRLSAHARLGFARLDTTNELGQDDHTSGAAFGLGGQLHVTGPMALRADYTRLQLNDVEADVGTLVFSVGF